MNDSFEPPPTRGTNDRLSINADWLMKLRWVAVVGQLTTIAIAASALHIPFQLTPLLVALAVTTATNLVFTLWLRGLGAADSMPVAVSTWHRVFMALMLLDLVVLTSLLYFTGGHANPFSLFYFVNLALAGILLPARRAWLLTALSIVSFAALFCFQVPLSELQRPESLQRVRDVSSIALAHQGLLIAFATCSSVIVYFVTRLTAELKRRDTALRQSQMRQARSDKWEALGTLTAGAAHELATPLTTIAIVSKELEHSLKGQDVSRMLRDDVGVIRKEVDRCRVILDRMSMEAGHATAEIHTTVTSDQLIASTLGELPFALKRIRLTMDEDAKRCRVDLPVQSVSQALRGVLQNALDASPDKPIDLEVTSDHEVLRIVIRDEGVGMSTDVLQRADEPFFSTKEAGKGMGLGRFLARTIFERVGGTFETESMVGAGTEVVVRVPLQKGSSHRG